ncbi:MAG: methyltransferase domain-containing protein [Vicinamibacterales bacterium]
MTPDLLNWICCPDCKSALTAEPQESSAHGIESGTLRCTGCASVFPISAGVPRFVRDDGYVSSFSHQWNWWRRVQIDGVNGRSESEETFIEKTGLTPDDVRGRLVLDVGCGAGRFSDVVSRWGGRVIGIDYSRAVDAAQANLASRGTVDVIQADVFRLPFRDDTFDVIFSLGVLHHTRDTREAFLQLPRLLKDFGQLAVWLYYYTDPLYKAASDFWRSIFSRVPPRLAYAWCWLLVALVSPLYRSSLVRRSPLWHLPRLLPVNTHPDFHWRVLDTFDWWTPVYQDKDCSMNRVVGWFREAGLRNIEALDFPTSVRGVRDEAGRLPLLRSELPARHDLRFVIFGSGAGGHEAYRRLSAMGLADRVVAVCDNDPARHGRRVGHVTIRPFTALAREDYDFVVIASLPGKHAIGRQLRDAGLRPGRHFGSLEFVTDIALPYATAA